jgi:hypothetical protein
MAVKNLTLHAYDRTQVASFKTNTVSVPAALPDRPVTTPRQRALEAFCLAIFNLNEFVYVD